MRVELRRKRPWRRWAWLAMALAAMPSVVLAGCGAGGGTSASLTTDTHSARFATDAEKVAFLRRYLVFASPVQAAEFHVVYYDNSGGVPGPSDWDIHAALKVAPEDVALWTEGLRPADAAGADLAWVAALLPPEPRWARASSPKVYERPGEGVLVATYVPEGIVLKHVWTR
jgi:hypothetical protein